MIKIRNHNDAQTKLKPPHKHEHRTHLVVPRVQLEHLLAPVLHGQVHRPGQGHRAEDVAHGARHVGEPTLHSHLTAPTFHLLPPLHPPPLPQRQPKPDLEEVAHRADRAPAGGHERTHHPLLAHRGPPRGEEDPPSSVPQHRLDELLEDVEREDEQHKLERELVLGQHPLRPREHELERQVEALEVEHAAEERAGELGPRRPRRVGVEREEREAEGLLGGKGGWGRGRIMVLPLFGSVVGEAGRNEEMRGAVLEY